MHWFLTYSTDLSEEKYQSLLDESSVDVWKVDAEGRLDIRMPRQLYERLGWEECSVLHESVEELVLNFEKQLLSFNTTAADWFEEYVNLISSIYDFKVISLFPWILFSIAMMR